MSYDLTIPGFMKEPELKIIKKLASKTTGTIVECDGLWGRSTYAWARCSPESKVYCIDNWSLQLSDIREQDLPYIEGDLSKAAGDSYSAFIKNTEGLLNLTHIKESSTSVQGIYADLVFLDTAHTYDHLRSEINHWKNFLKPGGIICGHDFNPHSDIEVIQAVWNSIYTDQLNILVPSSSSLWILFKNYPQLQKFELF